MMGPLVTEGRWTVFVCEACGEATGRHKNCGNAHRIATAVVPSDDAAVERVWPEIAKRHEFSGDYAYEIVCDVLRLAGKTP